MQDHQAFRWLGAEREGEGVVWKVRAGGLGLLASAAAGSTTHSLHGEARRDLAFCCLG